jgi:hypothetical protein
MAKFTEEQRQLIATMLQESHEDGLFAVLSYLADDINIDGLRLSRNGIEFAIEPYGYTLYEDWMSRSQGYDWPEHELKDEYKA